MFETAVIRQSLRRDRHLPEPKIDLGLVAEMRLFHGTRYLLLDSSCAGSLAQALPLEHLQALVDKGAISVNALVPGIFSQARPAAQTVVVTRPSKSRERRSGADHRACRRWCVPRAADAA